MPPSGYNSQQAKYISEFLRSCVGALVIENRGLRDSESAIQKEIASINDDLQTVKRMPFERDLLGLTSGFYQALAIECPENLDELPAHAEKVLSRFRSRILDIHVAV